MARSSLTDFLQRSLVRYPHQLADFSDRRRNREINSLVPNFTALGCSIGCRFVNFDNFMVGQYPGNVSMFWTLPCNL